MGVLTTLLKLLKPGENDYYDQQTEQADNWDKVDNYAVLTNADKNGIWGGEYGGKIQDPIPKELNKRYIDNINGKAFICIKSGDSSVVSNTIEYFTPCNVVDNLGKLQNLYEIERIEHDSSCFSYKYANGDLITYKTMVFASNAETNFTYPIPFIDRPGISIECDDKGVISSATKFMYAVRYLKNTSLRVAVISSKYDPNIIFYLTLSGRWR